ncbi:MAG TPA: response regulator, partial [Verrucomicrobiales bacterium]|nr:response regulator [Verrucomicrobiales bacterium]
PEVEQPELEQPELEQPELEQPELEQPELEQPEAPPMEPMEEKAEILAWYIKINGEKIVRTPKLTYEFGFFGNYLSIYQPLYQTTFGYESELIGVLYLKADVTAQVQEKNDSYRSIVMVAVLTSFLITFLVAYRLQLIISRPILELARKARIVSDKKDYSQRAEKDADDEIGDLIDSFNLMMAEIQTRDHDLVEAQEATDQANLNLSQANLNLSQANENLEEKIEQRTAAVEKAKQEAEDARDNAERANLTKSSFLAKMSHELRTPLNAIIGYSEMLEEEAESMGEEDFVDDLKKIQGSGKHLLGLINDVLDISKIEAGKMELYLEDLKVSDLIGDVVDTITPVLDIKKNTLEVDCNDSLGTIRTDVTKTRQALFNLVSNASKFTENGIITISAEKKMKEDKEWIRLSVKDTGIGMTPEQREKVFDAFTQAETGTTRKYGGTGLGLTITQQFCRMMGGDVSVESVMGEGSEFIILLPSCVEELNKPAALEEEAQVVPHETPVEASSRILESLPPDAHRILSIDDDPTIHDLLKRHLSKEGFQVITASGGQEGIELAKKIKPDAITLDVMMPGMDGWAVLKTLKSDPELADIPVIMLSMIEDRNIGFALGASDYLTKPIQRSRLSSLLRRYCHNPNASSIMLVEDEPQIREMLAEILRKEEFQVFEARNGREALNTLKTQQPSLILLDLMMPEMDGIQFLEEFRKVDHWKEIPVIIVTGQEISEEDRKRLDGNVGRILEKGFYSGEDFLKEIRELVSDGLKSSGSDTSSDPNPVEPSKE